MRVFYLIILAFIFSNTAKSQSLKDNIFNEGNRNYKNYSLQYNRKNMRRRALCTCLMNIESQGKIDEDFSNSLLFDESDIA